MNRKEVIDKVAFKYAKRHAEIDGSPFPYTNFDEWMADAPLREAERERIDNLRHYWNDNYFLSCDEIIYKFDDPATDRLYYLTLRYGVCDQYWNVYLSYYEESTHEEIGRYLPPLGCYEFDELPFLKVDLIQILSKMFPAVEGWNNDFNYEEHANKPIPCNSLLFPEEFRLHFDYNTPESDAPKGIYVSGNIHLLRRVSLFQQRVAIIGSRNPDEKGLEVAYHLGQYHSSEIVVSGLARGIDTAAHKGCLDAGGQTIAVVGSGLDIVHPKENADLQRQIIDSNGLIISEQPEGTKASPKTLIARTRLQMALADKVVVVECEKESGTMHAVDFACKFHNPIFALDCDWSGNRYLIENGVAKPFKI